MTKPLGIILATTKAEFERQLQPSAARMAKQLGIPLEEAKSYWIHCEATPNREMRFVDENKWHAIATLEALRGQDVLLFISAHGESYGPTNGADTFSCFASDASDIRRVTAQGFVAGLRPYLDNFNSLSCVLESCKAAAPVFSEDGNEAYYNLQERLHLAIEKNKRVNFVMAHKNYVVNTTDGSWLLAKPGNYDITEHENTLVKYKKEGVVTETYNALEQIQSILLGKLPEDQCDESIKTVICELFSGLLEPSTYNEFKQSLDGITNGDMIAKLTATVAAINEKIAVALEKYDKAHTVPVVGTSVVTHSHAGELLHFDLVTQQQALGDFQTAVYSKMHEVLASVGGTAEVSTPEKIAVSNLFELVY